MARKAAPKVEAQPHSDFVEQFGLVKRVDPDEDFSDVDGDPANEFALDDKESDRKYVWAHNSPDGIGDYKGAIVPYRIEHYHPDGVKARMRAEHVEGEMITKRDHVLMSCDKALWQKRNRYERAQQLKHNETMFKRRQRDTDLRNMAAVRAEAASLER